MELFEVEQLMREKLLFGDHFNKLTAKLRSRSPYQHSYKTPTKQTLGFKNNLINDNNIWTNTWRAGPQDYN